MTVDLGLVFGTDNGEEVVVQRKGSLITIDVRDGLESSFYIELGQREAAAIVAALKTLGVVE